MSEPFWAEYARVQHLVEIGKARDEQLDHLLERISGSATPLDLHNTRRQLKNLDRNLARKDRSRTALLCRNAGRFDPPPAEGPPTVAIRRERNTAVRQAAGTDWELLRATVDGDYAAVAARLDVPVGTLKSRVSRARRELRSILGCWITT